MNSEKISELLHNQAVRQHYKAQPGDEFAIELPQVPLTRHTEFLTLAREITGNQNCVIHEAAPSATEGHLQPSRLMARAVRPGTAHIVLRAINSLSGEEIPDVEPLDIMVEVKRQK